MTTFDNVTEVIADGDAVSPVTAATVAECGCKIVTVVFLEDHYGNHYNVPAEGWATTFEHTKTYLGGALFAGDTVSVRGNVDEGFLKVVDGGEVVNEQHWRTEDIADCDRHGRECMCPCCFDVDSYLQAFE